MTSIRDIGIVGVVLFVLAIVVVFSVQTSHTVLNRFKSVNVINSTPEAVTIVNSVDSKINMMDYVYFCTFLGFFLSIIIFGWLSGSNPIFAGIYFFVLIIFAFVAVLLQQAWGDIVITGGLTTQMADLPLTAYIMSHLGYFIVLAGLIGLLFSFAKSYFGKVVQ